MSASSARLPGLHVGHGEEQALDSRRHPELSQPNPLPTPHGYVWAGR